MRRTSRVEIKREAVIDPSLEKTLLSLHAAMNLGSFWEAVQHLLAAAIPNCLIGLMLQPNPSLPIVRLTRSEQEVARLVCEGRSNQEIANDACLSLPMVKKHLHAVFRKLEVPSRTRLVALMQ